MRKFELRVDELTVESFQTSPAAHALGTVVAHQMMEVDAAFAPVTQQQTCGGWHTCGGEETCNFGGNCYTFHGGYTCETACDPTAPNCTALL